jgi:hypothetical protein
LGARWSCLWELGGLAFTSCDAPLGQLLLLLLLLLPLGRVTGPATVAHTAPGPTVTTVTRPMWSCLWELGGLAFGSCDAPLGHRSPSSPRTDRNNSNNSNPPNPPKVVLPLGLGPSSRRLLQNKFRAPCSYASTRRCSLASNAAPQLVEALASVGTV